MMIRRMSVAFIACMLLMPLYVVAQELDDHGGIDNYGHTWIDNQEREGPEYDWIDISEGGTAVEDMGDDDFAGPFELPWEFNYYGIGYDEVYICSNGYLRFGGGSTSANNTNIPSRDDPDNIIALFWVDLDPSEEGTIYYGTDEEDNWICQFDNVYDNTNDDNLTAEIILRENGEIYFQYNIVPWLDMEPDVSIGIENIDGSAGLPVWTYAWDEEDHWQYPRDELGILFYRLETDASASGTVTDSENGEAIEGVNIRFYIWFEDEDWREYEFYTTSDEDGNYEFQAIFSGEYWINAWAEGYGEYQADAVWMNEGENEYDIEMGPPPEISVEPDVLMFFAVPGANSDTAEVTITNVGGSRLWFWIDIWWGEEFWLEPVDWEGFEEGELEPDAEITIELYAICDHLDIGEYESQIMIGSNDQENPEMFLPVILVVGADPPEEFDLVSPENESAVGTGYYPFTWEVAEPVTQGVPITYDLYVSMDPDDLGDAVAEDIADTLWVHNLESRGTYYWTVYAKVIDDIGTWASATNQFTAGLRPPEAFDILTPDDSSTHELGDVILVWQHADDPDNDDVTYNLFLSTDPENMDEPFLRGIENEYYIFEANDPYQYYWTVSAQDNNEGVTYANSIWSFVVEDATGLSDSEDLIIPKEFAIESAWPNPFNPLLNIRLAIPQNSDVNVKIFDLLGREVTRLYTGTMTPGYHLLQWKSSSPSGVYLVNASSSTGWYQTRKVMFLK
ncbi:carboxypeptidase regulatory-like domain-containing protein [Calditrichota bacterium]